MLESELVPGDIIFFTNNYKESKQAEHSYTYVDHVAMFVGFDTNKIPMIVHSISAEKGHYHPLKQSGLCYTSLRVLLNQYQSDPKSSDNYYDVSYHVYRYGNPKIVARAQEILEKQAGFRLPYDEKRLDAKIKLEDQCYEAEDFLKLGKETYETEGRYRAVKYAARYPQPWTRTRRDGVGRGITCSMAVILAFQVAELLEIEAIKRFDEVPKRGTPWVSDKYAKINEQIKISDLFLNYLKQIRDPQPPQYFESDCYLSSEFWNEDKLGSLDQFTHKTLAVDAKCTGAAGLQLFMEQHTSSHPIEQWHDKGMLIVADRNFTPAEKENESRRRSNSYVECLHRLSLVVNSNSSLVSPRASISPKPTSYSLPSSRPASPLGQLSAKPLIASAIPGFLLWLPLPHKIKEAPPSASSSKVSESSSQASSPI
ncbi:MAG: hypothetical protein PSV35_09495 [bacterium]|nr:hypothetical protein [bacterium]